MNKVDILLAKKLSAYDQAKKTQRKLDEARKLYNELEDRYYRDKRAFETADRELAMHDGRYQVLPPTGPGAEKAVCKPKAVSFTLEQIQKLADTLGVTITLPNEEDCEDDYDVQD